MKVISKPHAVCFPSPLRRGRLCISLVALGFIVVLAAVPTATKAQTWYTIVGVFSTQQQVSYHDCAYYGYRDRGPCYRQVKSYTHAIGSMTSIVDVVQLQQYSFVHGCKPFSSYCTGREYKLAYVNQGGTYWVTWTESYTNWLPNNTMAWTRHRNLTANGMQWIYTSATKYR